MSNIKKKYIRNNNNLWPTKNAKEITSSSLVFLSLYDDAVPLLLGLPERLARVHDDHHVVGDDGEERRDLKRTKKWIFSC